MFLSGSLFAAEKTFIREYTYQASDYDSKVTSRGNALEEVKRILLEEVAVFLKSEFNTTTRSTGINGDYTLQEFDEHKITSITAGVTETKILDEKWNGIVYWIKAEITINEADIYNQIDAIINSDEKLAQLEDLRKNHDEAKREIVRLKKALSKATSLDEQVKLTKRYTKQITSISSLDWLMDAFHTKDVDLKIKKLQKAIELDPTDESNYFLLGSAFAEKGDTSSAIDFTEKAIELNPNDCLSYVQLGDFLLKNGDFHKAVNSYETAIKVNERYYFSYYRLGQAYHGQNILDKAMLMYEKAIEKVHKTSPDYFFLLFNLGIVSYENGNVDNAIRAYETAIKINSTDAGLYANLGNCFYKTDLKKAVTYYKKSANLGHKGSKNWLKNNGYGW